MPAHVGTDALTAAPEGAGVDATAATASDQPAEAPPLEIIPNSDTVLGTVEPYAFPTREHPATIPVPAHDSGWSVSVALPMQATDGTAYALCRSAKLENNTLLVQYRKRTGSWQDFVSGADGREERYQSTTVAQEVTYFFVPAGELCKGY